MSFPHSLYHLPLHIGYTGPRRGMTQVQKAVLQQRLCYFHEVNIHHGDCEGGDEQMDAIARALGFDITLHPPIAKYARAYCEKRGPTTVRPAREFIDRNHDIVDECERMFATPAQREEQWKGSGTWATIRYTRLVGKPLTIIWPDGEVA